MFALGLLLNTVGLGLFCWLIFTLAVYALPFFVAINVGMWAFQSGAGLLGTPIVAIAAGATTLALAQLSFATARSTILRTTIAAVFASPAAFAGYHVVLAMAQIGIPSLAWQGVFACFGATVTGGAAWMRLTTFAEPVTCEQGRVVSDGPHQFYRSRQASDDVIAVRIAERSE